MHKHLTLVLLAVIGLLQTGCEFFGSNQPYSGRGTVGSPQYFEGPPFYGAHTYPYMVARKTDPYYGDKDIGTPYYICEKVMYYRLGGGYCYYLNHIRYYIKDLPEGGRYVKEPACSVHPDRSKDR